MSPYDRKNYILTSLALIITIFGLGITYYGIHVSRQIARESGSFDKAAWEIGIGDIPLVARKDNFVLIGAPVLATTSTPVVGAIPFTLRSTGKKSLETLLLSFQYHELFQRELLEELDYEMSGAFSAIQLKKNTSSQDKRIFVSYSLDTLNPGVVLRILEPVFLEETILRHEESFTTKDGVNLTTPIEAIFSKQFGFSASARDTQVVGYSISVSIDQADSLNSLLKSPQLMTHIARRQKDIRQRLRWPEYLSALITSSPEEQATLVYVGLTEVTKDGVTIYAPTQKQTSGQVKFPLLNWTLLFKSRN
ncbi:hypothetical protein [Comamonas sp. CMM02]|uniref:hypothetical protein n=1 Tax=Comamonas sp. CMM02 TaxID=2769307 RepID=UPI00177B514D|nr:hypothetical protein [Comamonas sp. CMM02]MBD9402118.1 hypothetical protein [Comamonas sp. CMM02]